MNLPEHYAVPEAGILAGEYPGHRDPGRATAKLRALHAAGVDCFVDLTEEGELEPYASLLPEGVEHHRAAVRDVSVPRASADMRRILDVIEEALARGRRPYVHCWGGVGRTGTVVGCLVAGRAGMSGDAALQRVAELFAAMPKSATRQSPETDEQRAFVRSWPERERFAGALLGLAAGDAVGTTLEFKPPGSFEPLTDMLGGGPFRLPAGCWTDDTSMALCLADSLVARRGFDARDQMERYVRWWRDGLWSSTGRCFDIGNTTAGALARFAKDGDPVAGDESERAAGNGSLMRLAPVAMAFAGDWPTAHDAAASSSRTTHGAPQAVDACRYAAGLLWSALNGATRAEILAPMHAPQAGWWDAHPLHPAVAEVASGSYLRKRPPAIRGTGYVVESLEAALWAMASADDFESVVLNAVNLGNDADTTGAIAGQIAGALFGASAIPAAWRSRLARHDEIAGLADDLRELASRHSSRESRRRPSEDS